MIRERAARKLAAMIIECLSPVLKHRTPGRLVEDMADLIATSVRVDELDQKSETHEREKYVEKLKREKVVFDGGRND